MPEGYDVAQICPNGHVVNDSTINAPHDSEDFCERCGEKTITSCEVCQKPIRGSYWSWGAGDSYNRPSCCSGCGNPFPWTERASQAAIELFLDESGFTGEQAEEFKQNVQDLVRDTPRTQVAANRVKGALAKVGPAIGKAFRDIMVDVLSEAAKKTIWPNNPM